MRGLHRMQAAVWAAEMAPCGAILAVHLLEVVDGATDVGLTRFLCRCAAIVYPNSSVRLDLSSKVQIYTILALDLLGFPSHYLMLRMPD